MAYMYLIIWFRFLIEDTDNFRDDNEAIVISELL